MSDTKQTEFKGYAIHDIKKWNDFSVVDFQSKTLEEYDVEIKVAYCGVCGSDVHTITGGWSEDIITPMITGHEICGKVTAVGPKVTEFKVGDRAGVGAQAWSCQKCNRCKADNENYCKEQVDTYNAKYPHTGEIAHGGYSTGVRVHQAFVFPVPDQIEDQHAGPFFCAGLTVYSPLKRNGCGPGKKVGIIGLGGLGHFAVMFAAAMGAEVTVFTSSENKKQDALKMGAKTVVDYVNDKDWQDKAGDDFHFILSTRDVAEGFPLPDFLSVLDVNRPFVTVGLPDDPLPGVPGMAFAANGAYLGGSHIGSKKEVLEMLDLAVKHKIKPWVEVLPMSKAGEAVSRLKTNDIRYRFVLKQDIDV